MKKMMLIILLTIVSVPYSLAQTTIEVPSAIRQWINENLKQAKNKTLISDYNSASFFSKDSVHIIGYLKRYDTTLGFSTGMLYASNEITREDYPVVIEIYKDGRFEVRFPLNYPKMLNIDFKDKWAGLYIEPGHTLAMIIDWDKMNKNNRDYITYEGAAGEINTELNSLHINRPDFNELLNDVKAISPAEFKIKLQKKWNESSTSLQKQIAAKKFTQQTKIIATHINNTRYGTSLFDYVMYREFEKKDSTNKMLTKSVPDSYYDFLKAFDLNDKALLIPNEFSSFINRFEFSEPFNTATKLGNKSTGTDLEQALKRLELTDSIVFEKLKMQPNLIYNIAKLRRLSFLLSGQLRDSTQKDRNVYLNVFNKSITEPFLKAEAQNVLKTVQAKESGKGKTIPPTKAGAIFKKIIAAHKGKMVFVDFWATTCGPCVGSIKSMFETRKKYKENQDFDFVFITSEDESPTNNYKTFIAEQQLVYTHILNVDDYRYLRELFKFNGIPRYVVIDRDGNILDDDFPMYSFKYELAKLIPKYAVESNR